MNRYKDVWQMWDKRCIFNLGLLVFYVVAFNIYLWQLFETNFTQIQIKAFYYLVTIIVFSMLTIQDYYYKPNHFNIICKSVIIFNFIEIYLILRGVNLLNNIFCYNGLIFAISIAILIAGAKHGYFKQNTND